jgi:hypothetical protein
MTAPTPPTPSTTPTPSHQPLERRFEARPETRPRQAKDVKEFPLGEAEVMLFAEGRQVVHTLNVSAWAIWGLCDGSRSVSAIANELAADLRRAPEELLPDVLETVARLGSLGLLDDA